MMPTLTGRMSEDLNGKKKTRPWTSWIAWPKLSRFRFLSFSSGLAWEQHRPSLCVVDGGRHDSWHTAFSINRKASENFYERFSHFILWSCR